MRFDIKYFLCVGMMFLPSCKEPPIQVASIGTPSPSSTQVGLASPSSLKGTLVFCIGEKLEAFPSGQRNAVVLRDKFRVEHWNFSPDGKTLCFAQVPEDVDFFDAGAVRSYLFTAKFNSKQNVLLTTYGKKRVPAPSRYGYSFDSSTWAKDGKTLVVTQTPYDWYGDEPGPTPGWSQVAFYDVKTRRQTWNADFLAKQIPQLTKSYKAVVFNLSDGALSPDGQFLVCAAQDHNPDSGRSTKVLLLRFDLKNKRTEMLVPFPPLPHNFECVWHPTQKKFVFVGSTSPTNPTANLFVFDLNTNKLIRLTNNAQDDFSPQWSLDGKQIYWIRGSAEMQNSQNNQIFRANADGSNATPIFPQLRGVTRIQLLPKIADWSRYRKLSIEPLAGKDK